MQYQVRFASANVLVSSSAPHVLRNFDCVPKALITDTVCAQLTALSGANRNTTAMQTYDFLHVHRPAPAPPDAQAHAQAQAPALAEGLVLEAETTLGCVVLFFRGARVRVPTRTHDVQCCVWVYDERPARGPLPPLREAALQAQQWRAHSGGAPPGVSRDSSVQGKHDARIAPVAGVPAVEVTTGQTWCGVYVTAGAGAVRVDALSQGAFTVFARAALDRMALSEPLLGVLGDEALASHVTAEESGASDGNAWHWASLGLRRTTAFVVAARQRGMADEVPAKVTIALEAFTGRPPEATLPETDAQYAGLDACMVAQYEEARLVREQGLTVMFVTHDLEEALYLGDRVIALRAHPTPEKPSLAAVIDVPIARPRHQLSTKEHPEFLRLRRELYAYLGHS